MRLTSLADLKPFKTGWKVQVKVLHTWKQYQTKSGESLEIILADEMGTKIYATVKKNPLHRFERLMVVGEWKFIENFSLNKASIQDELLPCTLWGKFGEQVYSACQNAGKRGVIIVIRFGKINVFRGERQITRSFQTSKVLIDLNDPDLVCIKCGKKVYKIPKREDEKFCDKTKKLYSCETCDAKISSVSARYKLHLCVMNNTSKIKCFLYDSNAKNIVNQSADEILKGTYDEIRMSFPHALQNLVGKTFQFLICVEKENLYGGSNTYKGWKGLERQSDGGDQSLFMSADQASLMNTHSQEFSDDVSGNIKTPLTKREHDDHKYLVDSSSSSKKSLKVLQRDELEDVVVYFEHSDIYFLWLVNCFYKLNY
ncbi:hypothetical protein EUTSA_v10003082mg [Eutrema salsugineum]|uniref:Uncharacterized protein n=1 Tax=Eutrema salsugineum TaxID=72664 RepID=V4L0A3_EUTSA|nr:hypothetical protein EUTSA_v10003082mg [Eutrema salsugineum]